jgi:hypothetical protein
MVVDLVVAVLPLARGGGVVPLPRGRVDLRVTHPVPLAVHDVVADLHVLEDLGHRQAGGAEPPGRAHALDLDVREQQHGAAAHLEVALHLDDLADVGGVTGAAAVHDLLAQGVELVADALDLLGGQVRGRVGAAALLVGGARRARGGARHRQA